MGLLRNILGSHYFQQSPDSDPARQDRANRESLLRLTLSFGRRKVQLEIGPSAGADSISDNAETIPPHRQVATEEAGRQNLAAISFWDALEPTEREALRSVASWRTFAAGATLMHEGDRADHVIVILGGHTKICVNENGRERVLAVRGVGQLVGERGALEVSVRSATVIALEMVWALVVQTKDFATFLSVHRRVLSIVQAQRYDRRTGEPTGFDRQGSVAGQPDRGLTAEYPPQDPQPLDGENCTVFLSDVVEFGARWRNDKDRLIIRDVLFSTTNAALHGIPGVRSEDRGDGLLTVIPPHVSTAKVMDLILGEFPAVLERHNSTQREAVRFKLRFAVNVGPVVTDTMGVSGEAIIVVARLIEAPNFKEALKNSTASLGFIASPFVYETVIRHGSNPSEVAGYSQVPVEVKESATTAWMKLFDAPALFSLVSHPTAPGFSQPY